MTNSDRLKEKVCIVNGAASEIGAAVAKRFAQEGGIVIGVDIREHDVGDLSLSADLTDEVQVERAYSEAFEKYGRLDVIYNNMGLQHSDDRSALDVSIETWNMVLAANLTSIFLCCKHGIPYLLKSDPSGGSIINSASFLASTGAATSQMAYSAAKAGVIQLTRDLGIHLARSNVRVNAVSFGPISIARQQAVFEANPGSLEKRIIHWPMGRFGTMDEVTGTIAFLASSDSGFITAAEISLDGGINVAFTIPE